MVNRLASREFDYNFLRQTEIDMQTALAYCAVSEALSEFPEVVLQSVTAAEEMVATATDTQLTVAA